MKHISLDIETIGDASDAAIIAIGAIEFDLYSTGWRGIPFHITIDMDDAISTGGTVSGSTLKWWMQQDPEARDIAFGGKSTMKDALMALKNFVDSISGGDPSAVRVWAKSPKFDVIILENAMKRLGVQIPWAYNSSRDVRPILDLVDNEVPCRWSHWLQHHAMFDAMYQAECITQAYRKLRR